MALLLAPYNEAMRIGMGFNSYTQQLCTNDVVRLPGGAKASMKDAKVVAEANGTVTKSVLSGSDGTTTRKVVDGQSDISQVVTWKAGLIETLSDVTSSLHISGALNIQIAAIGGGAGASAAFDKSSKIVKSDAKYEITVKVANQRFTADDVTEFTPIPNVPASKFNEVYGDSFISGFIEGGVFSAVILKTMMSQSDLEKMGGGIDVNLNFPGIAVKGKAEGSKNDESKITATKTDIILQWSGGGDIKPDNIGAWDVDTLMKVAMEFPDKVAACPQRTFAILTKYTSLRSFYEQTVKGTPLDYEIAGIYTSSLLDAYTEYKAMWEDLHQTIKEMERGTSLVHMSNSSDKLFAYAALVKGDYDRRKVLYDGAKQALEKASGAGTDVTLEEPLPANAVSPYDADPFGLDKAARDCRFEMIKIVREVNAVTFDPKIATDTDRNWRYLSPAVFRLLLPTDKEPLPTPQEIKDLRSELAAQVEPAAQRAKDLEKAQADKTNASSSDGDLDTKLTEAESRLEAMRRERDEVQARFDQEPDVVLSNIFWGNTQWMGNTEVENRILGHIRDRKEFKWDLGVFGKDPIPYVVKTGTVTYRRKGQKPATITFKDNDSYCF